MNPELSRGPKFCAHMRAVLRDHARGNRVHACACACRGGARGGAYTLP
jgi:hypothetical protein